MHPRPVAGPLCARTRALSVGGAAIFARVDGVMGVRACRVARPAYVGGVRSVCL